MYMYTLGIHWFPREFYTTLGVRVHSVYQQ